MSSYTQVLYINPKFRNDGSSFGVVVEAMKFLKDKTQNFDFAGSMIPASTAAARKAIAPPKKERTIPFGIQFL